MTYFAWDDAKNAKLMAERDNGFEDVVFQIERGDLLDILEHPRPVFSIREGHVPRGSAAEHLTLEQGPGGNPEASVA